MRMLVGKDQGKDHGTGDTKNHLEHCNNTGHAECEDQKTFSCTLIAAIVNGKGKASTNKFASKYNVCKNAGYVKNDCIRNSEKSVNND